MARENKKISGVALAMIPAEIDWGPAMKALPNDRWRAFVMAMVNMGVGVNHAECARMAGFDDGGNSEGYSKVQGHHLSHDPRVQAAIQEVGRSRLRALTTEAIKCLSEGLTATKIAGKFDTEVPDWAARRATADSILDRGGLHALSEHHVVVTTTKTREEKLIEIAKLAKLLGKDPKELLGNMADALEGDFSIVKENGDGGNVESEKK